LLSGGLQGPGILDDMEKNGDFEEYLRPTEEQRYGLEKFMISSTKGGKGKRVLNGTKEKGGWSVIEGVKEKVNY